MPVKEPYFYMFTFPKHETLSVIYSSDNPGGNHVVKYNTIASEMKLGRTLFSVQQTAAFVFQFPLRFNAFHPDTRKPMHRECGFIRLKPDTNKVAFISAQNTGTHLITTLGGGVGPYHVITCPENYCISHSFIFNVFHCFSS